MDGSFQKVAGYGISHFDISLVVVVFQFEKYPGKIDSLFRHPVSVVLNLFLKLLVFFTFLFMKFNLNKWGNFQTFGIYRRI